MTEPLAEEIGAIEGRQMLDDAARRHLGIDGAEFLRAYRAGEINCCDPGVQDVAQLIPFACAPPLPPDDCTFLGWISL